MKKLSLLFVLLCSALAYGQGGLFSDIALNSQGRPAGAASVRTCLSTDITCPVSDVVVYSNVTLTTPKIVSADNYGNFSFYGNPGLMLLEIQFGTAIYRYVVSIPIDVTNATIKILHLHGTQGPDSGSSPVGPLIIENIGTTTVALTAGIDTTGTANGWIQSRDTASTTKYNLALEPLGGNVGIGLKIPASTAKLHVRHDTSTSGYGEIARFDSNLGDEIVSIGAANTGVATIGVLTNHQFGLFSNNIEGLRINQLGQVNILTNLITNTLPSTAWAIDGATSSQTISLANNATYDLGVGGGLVIVNSVGGPIALFVCAAGTCTVISDPSGAYTGVPGTGAKTNLFYNGTTAYRLENKTGVTVNYVIFGIRTRSVT